jgi:signal transduction histidine kinase
MTDFNSFGLIPLTAAFVNFLLSFYVLSRGPRLAINWVYALWGMSITVWNLGTFFMFYVNVMDPRADADYWANFWARFLQLGVIFLPPSVFHLCTLIAQVPLRRLVLFLYFVHVCFAVTLFAGDFVTARRIAAEPQTDFYYSMAGPWYWAFLYDYAICSCATMAILWLRQRKVPPLHRARLRWLIVANGILIVFGTHDLLPILGIERYAGPGSTPIYPLGSAAAIFYGIIVCYSVLQHQLLDIRVTLSRFAAQGVRLLFMLLIGMTLLLFLTLLAPKEFRMFYFLSASGVLLMCALIASVLFPRFFGSGEETVERWILGDRFEYHDKIQGFIRSIPWYSDTTQLLKDLHELLVSTVRVKSYQIILLDESTRAFALFCSYPDRPPVQLPNFHSESPVFEVFRRSKREYLACNHSSVRETDLERAAKDELREFAPDFFFPFISDEDAFGLLLIGPKDSNEPYTPHDLHLLAVLVKNLGSVINQIRLKNQVLLAEELELLGRMSRGMAHDMNNLLTPVSTYLQISASQPEIRNGAAELLPTALRNVETMHAYIKEALFFSKNHTLQIQESRLDQVIVKALDLIETKLKRKKVEVIMVQLPKVSLEMDIVLIQRLIGNVVSNAIDASPHGSQIRIEVIQLAKTEAARDWWRIRIIDQGQGISEENLRRIFTPYFTTKDKGDHDRGFGLGLAICRKIVHLHGGSLSVNSEEKKGTTVQIDLPSRQLAANRIPSLGLATAVAS